MSKEKHSHYYRVIGLTGTNEFVLVCNICYTYALLDRPTNDFKLVLIENNGDKNEKD